MTNIPVIDFKNLPLKDDLNGEELDSWKKIGEEVYKACSEYGFFYIKNHGISKEDINTQFNMAKEYFNFSEAEKNKFGIKPDNYGYCAMEQETLEVGTAPDPKEAFNVWTSTGKIPNDRIPPYFKKRDSKVQEFYSQCHQLSIKILRGFALGLKLDDYKFFDESNELGLTSGTTLRYLHYPPIPSASADLINKGIIRAGAHSDYGVLTLLFQSPCDQLDSDFSGLQILHEDKWINVGNNEDYIVVNTGDLMNIWTEGRLKSAIHRVLVPNTDIAKIHRYTMAFFSHSNSDYSIHRLETPIQAPNPAKQVTNSETGKTEYHSTLGASPFVFGENDGIYLHRRLSATTEYK